MTPRKIIILCIIHNYYCQWLYICVINYNEIYFLTFTLIKTNFYKVYWLKLLIKQYGDISDVKDGFEIVVNPNIAVGDDVTFVCRASRHNYVRPITWTIKIENQTGKC